eukprot:s2754_g6.t1
MHSSVMLQRVAWHSAFYSDTEGAQLNEAMRLPGGDPEDGIPEGPDDIADPHVPRKLLDEHILREKSVRSFSPYGLRVLGRRLFVCNSDEDDQLQADRFLYLLNCGLVRLDTRRQEEGTGLSFQECAQHLLHCSKCGVVGTRFQIPGISLRLESDKTILPVHRYDDVKMVWTAEQAPHVMVENYKLPKGKDGKLDFDMLPVMPFKMTRFSPGEAPEPIESSAGALAVSMAIPRPLVRLARARREDFLVAAKQPKTRNQGFLWDWLRADLARLVDLELQPAAMKPGSHRRTRRSLLQAFRRLGWVLGTEHSDSPKRIRVNALLGSSMLEALYGCGLCSVAQLAQRRACKTPVVPPIGCKTDAHRSFRYQKRSERGSKLQSDYERTSGESFDCSAQCCGVFTIDVRVKNLALCTAVEAIEPSTRNFLAALNHNS